MARRPSNTNYTLPARQVYMNFFGPLATSRCCPAGGFLLLSSMSGQELGACSFERDDNKNEAPRLCALTMTVPLFQRPRPHLLPIKSPNDADSSSS